MGNPVAEVVASTASIPAPGVHGQGAACKTGEIIPAANFRVLDSRIRFEIAFWGALAFAIIRAAPERE